MRLPIIAFIAAVSTGHVLTMLGFSAFPALLPEFSRAWALTGTQGGIVNSAIFAGYTLAVPVLVALTDRIDARRIYIASAIAGAAAHLGFAYFADGPASAAVFRAIYGASLAGTYMPGLRVIGDHLPPATVARATGFYTAAFGLGSALSYVASDYIAAMFGWQMVFAVAAGLSVLAAIVMFAVARPCKPPATHRPWLAMLDPRPVFANRSAMAYSICYALHAYELFTVRSWLVAFLAFAALTGGGTGFWAPAMVAAAMTLLGVFASVGGNELAIRAGRRRVISFAMVISGLFALGVAGAANLSYMLCAALVLVHGVVIMLDSAALTAGAFGAAKPTQRGITMAVHSTLGFGGAMIGPFVFGLLVDAFDGGPAGWSAAYGHMALIVFAGPLVLKWLKPAALAGDRE